MNNLFLTSEIVREAAFTSSEAGRRILHPFVFSVLALKPLAANTRRVYSTGKVHDLKEVNFVKFYLDADRQRMDIIKDNKDKAGIYLWENKENGNLYIGSSVDLRRRMWTYYNINSLIKEKRPGRHRGAVSPRSILKYGYTCFSLYILEYCNKEDLIRREHSYIDFLKPKYNISLAEGTIVRKTKKEKTCRPSDVKAKISATMSGRTFTDEHKLSLSLSKKNSKKLSIFNIQTNEETIFHSISQAERSMGFPKGAIGLNLKSKAGAPYRGIYKFTLK